MKKDMTKAALCGAFSIACNATGVVIFGDVGVFAFRHCLI